MKVLRYIATAFIFASLAFSCVKPVDPAKPDDKPVTPPEEKDDPQPVDSLPATAIADWNAPMPVISIETVNHTPITSKEEYLRATVTLTDTTGKVSSWSGGVRGRGNSSWSLPPKKSYRIKFDSKHSLLGEPADKSWALLANYFDKTMLRNEIGYYMGRMARFDYTPASHFVELWLNGDYLGLYQLVDHLKISKSRVDSDFLLEIDEGATDSDIKFNTAHLYRPVVIKDPDLVTGDDQYNYIVNVVRNVDTVLYSQAWRNSYHGYRTKMDTDTFVDWYLINEITRNNDAILYKSCFMNYKRGGLLKMGPVWDFDIAFGNTGYNDNFKTEGWWIYRPSCTWFYRMLDDPWFKLEVKNRFLFFYENRGRIYDYLDGYAAWLAPYVDKNDEVWNVMFTQVWNCPEPHGGFQAEIDAMKSWLEERFEWMYKEYYSTDNQ